jgi:hypothetical protein
MSFMVGFLPPWFCLVEARLEAGWIGGPRREGKSGAV